MLVLRQKWLPHRDDSIESFGNALWLEDQYWQKMEAAIHSGIVKAFKGI